MQYSLKKSGYSLLVASCTAAALSACGGDGGSGNENEQPPAAQISSATTTLEIDTANLPDGVATQLAIPLFHTAPVLLDAPSDADAYNPANTANQAPRQQAVSSALAAAPTKLLTRQMLESSAALTTLEGISAAAPMGTSSTVSTYSPAQIRTAYLLPTLPATGSTFTAAQAALAGAGQTIYIVDAMHDPNAAAELAAFNQKFGLPACAHKAIAPTAALPLPAASSSACEFSVVYTNTSGAMTSAAPAYNQGWATEIALDVQWAHATAPLARIVLIEAPDASLNSLLGAIKLANAMGPGIVSMSFGANEGNWTSSVDAAFSASNMTYLAATGDSGAAVSWPAVSTKVLAVGGTTLTYTGTGPRSEIAWSGTGGGMSAYTPAPSYQNSSVIGFGSRTNRTVADVAFNADPYTGQYVAIITPGSSTVGWLSAGGTSLSTPQWAGLIASANASRLLAAKPILGAPHATLYGQIAKVPTTYASTFSDITKGSDGTCATCTASAGYDHLSGLGTPNGSSLLSALTGTSTPATPPVVTASAISGKVGTALTFSVSITAPNPVTYTLTGAPAGMAISSAGVVTWPTPIAGTYAVTVTAKDSKTALSGQGIYTVTIAPAVTAPVVTAATISGTPGKALSYTVAVSAPNPVTYTLSGAPTGMSISTAGVLSWASPVAGSYTVTVTAKDSKTGLTGQGVFSIKITAVGPVINAPAAKGVAGKLLTGTISISDPGASWLSISISGVPLGMMFSMSGTTLTYSWPSPITGAYSLKVTVTDSAGLSAQTTIPVTITAK